MKISIIQFLVSVCILQYIACAGQSGSKESVGSTAQSYTIPDSIAKDLKNQKAEIVRQMSDAQINHFVTHTPDGKFGYNIFIDGNIYIEQKTIPALEGNRGFATKEDAEKIALLVIEKLKHGEVPPSIMVEELKERGIK